MKLRREVVPPTPRPRRRWDPITFILIGLLVATSIGAVHEQRRLRARADAAEQAQRAAAAEAEAIRLSREITDIKRDIMELDSQLSSYDRPRPRRMGDFPEIPPNLPRDVPRPR